MSRGYLLHVYQSFGKREESEGVEEKAEQKKAKVQGKEEREGTFFQGVYTELGIKNPSI